MYLPGTVASTDTGLQSSPNDMAAADEVDSGESREPCCSRALRSGKSSSCSLNTAHNLSGEVDRPGLLAGHTVAVTNSARKQAKP